MTAPYRWPARAPSGERWSRIRTRTDAPAEWLGRVAADGTEGAEQLVSLVVDSESATEQLILLAKVGTSPSAWRGRIAAMGIGPVAWRGRLAKSAQSPAEWLSELVHAGGTSPAEQLVSLIQTAGSPAEWLPLRRALWYWEAAYGDEAVIGGEALHSRSTEGWWNDERGSWRRALYDTMRYVQAYDPARREFRTALLAEPAREQVLNAPGNPAGETHTLAGGTYVLSVEGSGSATISGAATGTATEGSPLVFTLGSSGSVTFTPTSLDRWWCEAGVYATSYIDTAATRAADRVLWTLGIDPQAVYLYLAYSPGALPDGAQTLLDVGGSGGERIRVRRLASGEHVVTHENGSTSASATIAAADFSPGADDLVELAVYSPGTAGRLRLHARRNGGASASTDAADIARGATFGNDRLAVASTTAAADMEALRPSRITLVRPIHLAVSADDGDDVLTELSRWVHGPDGSLID